MSEVPCTSYTDDVHVMNAPSRAPRPARTHTHPSGVIQSGLQEAIRLSLGPSSVGAAQPGPLPGSPRFDSLQGYLAYKKQQPPRTLQ